MKNTELDIVLILEILRKRWWAIVLCAVIGASLALTYSRFLVTPIYESTALLYVDPKTEDKNTNISFETQSINYVKAIMNTNIKILGAQVFMDQIGNTLRDEYGEEEYPEDEYNAKKLSSMISFEAIEDTKLFSMSVKSTEKEKALQIAQVAVKLSAVQLKSVAEANSVKEADPPILPKEASNNNTSRNTLVGLFIGAILCFGVLIVIELLDVRIKSEEDFINTYNIPLLGSVPNFEKAYKSKKKTDSDQKPKTEKKSVKVEKAKA